MTRHYLLDTGIAQDFQADRNGVRDRAMAERRRGHRIGICIPVLGELWSGVEGSANRERNLRSLRSAVKWLRLWPYTPQAAAQYGSIFVALRHAGRMMQQIDMQLGAIARTLPNCIIVSKDADLRAIPGVVVEDWTA